MRCELNEQQRPEECAEFVELLVQERVTSYLEIGSKYGGSLWAVGNALPKNSSLVAVDIREAPELKECVTHLRNYQDVVLIIGDSTKKETVDVVSRHGGFDAVFIDGDHHTEFVRSDWLNYGPMARKIVAFHDIGWPHEITIRKKPWKVDVPTFWRELKKQYKHIEIIKNNGIGIGVLWMKMS